MRPFHARAGGLQRATKAMLNGRPWGSLFPSGYGISFSSQLLSYFVHFFVGTVSATVPRALRRHPSLRRLDARRCTRCAIAATNRTLQGGRNRCRTGMAMGSVLTFDTKQGFIGKEGWRRASMIPFLGAE